MGIVTPKYTCFENEIQVKTPKCKSRDYRKRILRRSNENFKMLFDLKDCFTMSKTRIKKLKTAMKASVACSWWFFSRKNGNTLTLVGV